MELRGVSLARKGLGKGSRRNRDIAIGGGEIEVGRAGFAGRIARGEAEVLDIDIGGATGEDARRRESQAVGQRAIQRPCDGVDSALCGERLIIGLIELRDRKGNG